MSGAFASKQRRLLLFFSLVASIFSHRLHFHILLFIFIYVPTILLLFILRFFFIFSTEWRVESFKDWGGVGGGEKKPPREMQ
jgi:hypothetical protein